MATKKRIITAITALVLIAALAGPLVSPAPALAADTGVKYPGTVSTNSETWYYNDNTWSTPGNVGANDGNYASITSSSFDWGDYSYVLRSTNFGFSIPPDNTIKGIKVEIERYSDPDQRGRDALVQLTKNGTTRVGTNKADTSTEWPTSVAVKTYGGETDLWGTTWSRAEINASTFGVHLAARATDKDADIYVDFIRITVYYAPAVYHTITASAGAGGTITPSGSVPVEEGTDRTFDITPNTGHIVADVVVDSVSQGRLNSYTFTNVTTDHTIAATFEDSWKEPSSYENHGWSSPEDAYASDNDRASGGYSDEVEYRNFNIPAILAGSTIDGIEVTVEGYTTGRQMDIRLSWNNGSSWTTGSGDKTANMPSGSSDNEATLIFGGATDTWNRTWAYDEFTNDKFRVEFDTPSSGSGSVYVDQLQVKVHYTPLGPDIHITKLGAPNPVEAGQTIDYVYIVTRSLGNITSVTVTDDKCVPVYDSGDDTDGVLGDGETWVYTGSYVTTMADLKTGSVTNTATATGDPPSPPKVTDTDTETVTVTRPTAEDNPALAESCGMDVVLVLDSSESISDSDSNLDNVKDPAKAFVDALLPDNTLIGVVDFDSTVVGTPLDLTNNTTNINAAINAIANEGGTQYTNWEAGLTEARKILENDGYSSDRDDAEHPDLIILFSNGEPTVYGYPTMQGSYGGTEPDNEDIDSAIIAANAAKTSTSTGPIRILYVGVSGTTTHGEQVSGDNVHPPDAVGIGIDAITEDFSAMAGVLATQANVCPGTITAHKFNDLNGNGIQDVDEGDLEGWTMTLYSGSGCTGDPLEFGDTNASGDVSFASLTPGDYSVKETLEDGWANTTDLCQNVTLSAGGSETLNFGNRGALSISGMKFNDLDGEGDKDAGEPGLDGWEINLSGDATGTTTTAGGGLYSFDNVEPGTYTVSETLKAGWTQTYPTAPGTHTVILTDTSATDKDFGNWQPGTITIKKETDPSPDLTGTSFSFALGGDGSDSTTLKNGGSHTFSNLLPGTYTVTETVPGAGAWTLTEATCDGAPYSNGDNIVLDAGETVTCTFTNTFLELGNGPGPPAPPPAVGGEAYPVNKIAILAPWIVLGALLAGSITWLTLKRRRA